jgi:uncharacterized protein (DUF433 family)
MTVTHRIETNPKVMMGTPVFRGTRIPVELIRRKLREGATEKDILDAYPRLKREDIRAVVRFRRRNQQGGRSRRRAVPRAGIKQMVQVIVRRFQPDQIILFGSQARGDARPDSDIDLLVVMPVSGPKHKKEIEIGVALHSFRVAKDIIVTTPEEFEWRKEIPGTIERPAAQEGKVLYARA